MDDVAHCSRVMNFPQLGTASGQQLSCSTLDSEPLVLCEYYSTESVHRDQNYDPGIPYGRRHGCDW